MGNKKNRLSQTRLHGIDALRGSAIALMIIYHFCYDLVYFNFAGFDFYHDPFWLSARNFIVSLFLLVVGISLVLANQNGINGHKVMKRFAVILSAALFISLLTYFMFPGRTIFFGILHFIAFASLVGLLFYRFYWANLFTGIAMIVIGVTIKSALFDQPWLQWLGMMTHKPATEDYVPMLPWLGVVLIGMFIAKVILSKPALLNYCGKLPSSGFTRLLSYAGRHSLVIYLLHQPVLMALLFVAASLV
ncbi:MAG: heparan-alpha-glucosaminide N-acetyltransferase [Thioalkalispiraceae bacterium]